MRHLRAMTEYATYEILSGTTPVTNRMHGPLDDFETAKDLARQISEGQPGTDINVKRYVTDSSGNREWTSHAAQFVDGQEVDLPPSA
jgi:hypothetical protein